MNSLYNEGMDGEFAALSKIMNFPINGGVPRALDVLLRWNSAFGLLSSGVIWNQNLIFLYVSELANGRSEFYCMCLNSPVDNLNSFVCVWNLLHVSEFPLGKSRPSSAKNFTRMPRFAHTTYSCNDELLSDLWKMIGAPWMKKSRRLFALWIIVGVLVVCTTSVFT